VPDAPEVRELHEAATAASIAADYLALADLARQMIQLSERTQDARGVAWGRYFSGVAFYQRSDGPAAQREFRTSRDLFEKIGDREGVARGMLGLAVVALDIDADVDQARHLYDLAAPILRAVGDSRGLGNVLGNLGEICRLEGSPGKAEGYAAEALELFRESDNHALAGWQLTNIAHFRLLLRDEVGAIDCMHEAYEELSQDPVPRWIAWYFDTWFIIAATLGHWEKAAQIYAFSNRYRDEHSAPRYQGILPWFSGPVEQLSQNIGDDELPKLFDAGEVLTVDTAIALVFEIV
jgi:tetratricopeptide (TPR) repeat protein